MIELPEHRDVDHRTPTISLEEQQTMADRLGNRLTVTWLSDHRVNIRSSSWVGTIRLTQDLRVRVVPKLAGDSWVC